MTAAPAAVASDAVAEGQQHCDGEDREEDGIDDCPAHCRVLGLAGL